METILLKNGESVEVMDFEAWELWKNEHCDIDLFDQWMFITNGDCDYEQWADREYEEYVDGIIDHFNKKGEVA